MSSYERVELEHLPPSFFFEKPSKFYQKFKRKISINSRKFLSFPHGRKRPLSLRQR